MSAVDYAKLAAATQAYRAHFRVGPGRAFATSDPAEDGSDTAGTYPPPDDDFAAAPILETFDGVANFASVVGSIDAGGWSATLTIPTIPATFEQPFMIECWLSAWLGNVFGVPGAGGTDPDEILLFRGYMGDAEANTDADMVSADFPLVQTIQYLKDSSLSRAIEFGPDLAHPAPTTTYGVLDHVISQHTNIRPRSLVGLYLPEHTVNGLSLASGTLYSMLKGAVDNFSAGLGFVYTDREDNLQLNAHPNIVGAAAYTDQRGGSLADPAINYETALTSVTRWRIRRLAPRRLAVATMTVEHSDQTTATYRVERDTVGDRPTLRMRSDDDVLAQEILARFARHAADRRYDVEVSTPLNVVADLGYLVTASVLPRDNNLGVAWSEKPFVVTGVRYDIDLQAETFAATVSLSEVLV